VKRNEGSIPFTRSIDNQALKMQCSKSAVESNWKNNRKKSEDQERGRAFNGKRLRKSQPKKWELQTASFYLVRPGTDNKQNQVT
jgi:hypothetical protein